MVETIIFFILAMCSSVYHVHYEAKMQDEKNRLKAEGEPSEPDTELGELREQGKDLLHMTPMLIFGSLFFYFMLKTL